MTTQANAGASASNLIPIVFQEDELVNITKDGTPVTTSLIVADRFEKNHRDVLRTVRDLECSEKFNLRNFAPVKYADAKGEKRPMYLITRDGFTILAMGFTGKKTMEWKEKYIAAFNKMEQEIYHEGMITSADNPDNINDDNEPLATIRYKDYNAILSCDAVFLLKDALGGAGRRRDRGALKAVIKGMTELGTALAQRGASRNISVVDDNGKVLGEMPRKTLEHWKKELIELKIGKSIQGSKVMDWNKYDRMIRYRKMGLTQRETAKLLDVSRDAVQHFERIVRQYELKLVSGGAA